MSPRTHLKTDPRPGVLAVEAAGLAWLAEAEDGAPVVPVLNPESIEEDGHLAEPALESTRPDAAAAEAFGRLLARTHAAGAPWFGAPPRGWDDDGAMGNEALPLRGQAPAGDTPESGDTPGDGWGEFYASDRLLPYLPAARANGSIDADGESVVRRLCERLASGEFDHAQPGLVREPAARLHGDLWSGNVLWSPGEAAAGALPDTPGLREARGASDAVGILIDPAAHGGHAESDLAQLFVFGAPHAERIVAAYDEVSPLDGGLDGARERRGLHQLHMLVVHAALFGGSYGAQTVEAARAVG